MRALSLFLLPLGLMAGGTHAQGLIPLPISAALARAKVPLDAVALVVVAADGKTAPRLSHRANASMNPASVMKLVTTFAALDTLGPAFVWNTSVHFDGVVQAGTLQGNLYLKGQGDPKLVMERLWLLLRRVQGLGIKTIAGDIVLDRSAFEVFTQNPGDFDGEPLRPYNAAPDALLLNFKSVVMSFVPDRVAQVARVNFEPPLAGVQMQASVPLVNGECSDYRAALKADMSDPSRIRFGGAYSASCGEKVWPLAYADPASYSARAVEGLWREMGGQLSGRVREGQVPAALPAALTVSSPSLAETIRDINKFSNNVMAQQLFLTLSLQKKGMGTLVDSRALVQDWWRERVGHVEPPVLDNGSGLSRSERISAQALANLLQTAWASPLMPELMASLPIVGVDGTLKRIKGKAAGSAHLKSGSLRDVVAVAGYVHALSGQRYVLVAIANHPNANAARPALDALVEWTLRDL
jgi:serine-type D-Ala-D-Ala carboxypeptidase/endopeptidase (penicillin-binding protein 4)